MLPTEPGGTSQNRSAVARFSGAPVRLILDTDMGGGACRDIDDVVALCTLHAMMDNGEVGSPTRTRASGASGSGDCLTESTWPAHVPASRRTNLTLF